MASKTEDADALRARLKQSAWNPADVARADTPILAAITEELAKAEAAVAKAQALAADLLQPVLTAGPRAQNVTGSIASSAQMLKLSALVTQQLAAKAAETLKA